MVSDAFNTLVQGSLDNFNRGPIVGDSWRVSMDSVPNPRAMHREIYTTLSNLYLCFLISIGISQQVRFGWKHTAEVYVHAGMHGFMLGAIQSTCRSLSVSLLPPGHEGSFYSLYLLTDKGSSWIGPLIVAAINGSGVDKRYSVLFLGAQFCMGVFFFSLVDP
ncbi:vacuole effluxer Atg22 like-domain-containing protein, partial [Chytriomyces cf. hyalinus JEL632]